MGISAIRTRNGCRGNNSNATFQDDSLFVYVGMELEGVTGTQLLSHNGYNVIVLQVSPCASLLSSAGWDEQRQTALTASIHNPVLCLPHQLLEDLGNVAAKLLRLDPVLAMPHNGGMWLANTCTPFATVKILLCTLILLLIDEDKHNMESKHPG